MAQRRTLGFHLSSGVCRLFSLGLRWLLSHAAPATSTPQPSLLTSREMECSWLNGLGSEWQLKHMSVALTNISFSLLHSHSHFYFLFKCFFLSFRHSGYARSLYLFSDGVSPCTCSPLYTSRFLSPCRMTRSTQA